MDAVIETAATPRRTKRRVQGVPTFAEAARRVRQRVRAVLEWAVAMELRADNPCDLLHVSASY